MPCYMRVNSTKREVYCLSTVTEDGLMIYHNNKWRHAEEEGVPLIMKLFAGTIEETVGPFLEEGDENALIIANNDSTIHGDYVAMKIKNEVLHYLTNEAGWAVIKNDLTDNLQWIYDLLKEVKTVIKEVNTALEEKER